MMRSSVCGANDVTNVINIYYFNSVTSSSGGSLCGYTRFPPSVDRIIMKNSCAINGSTIVHELRSLFFIISYTWENKYWYYGQN